MINLNIEAFTQNLQTYMENYMELAEGDMSKALVTLTSETASIPTPKLINLIIDLVEDILMRLDVEDLIRCKSVCKSWFSFITSSRTSPHNLAYIAYGWQIIGSSNGLVCVSPVDAQVLVTNPSTREVKKLQPPPEFPNISMDREFLCWGFGHDSFIDDYKVVMGIKMGKTGTLFQVLSLKLNTWKVVKHVKFKIASGRFGILWNGALHWFMKDVNNRQIVLLSFDLSREEFREIPQPDDSRYVCDYFNYVGIVDECLCTYRNYHPYHSWAMKNYNDKDSWELLPDDFEMNKYDVAHTLKYNKSPPHAQRRFHSIQYLVSPHVYGNPKKTMRPKNNKRSDKGVSSYDVISSCGYTALLSSIDIAGFIAWLRPSGYMTHTLEVAFLYEDGNPVEANGVGIRVLDMILSFYSSQLCFATKIPSKAIFDALQGQESEQSIDAVRV
ncbi:putative F-box domain-containing protein, partial [Tanacetum coccineum]